MKYSKLFALALGIFLLVMFIKEDLFVENEEVMYYIALVVLYTAILGFIGGMIYLIVIDIINNKLK